MRYFVHPPDTLKAMLKAINRSSLDDLFSSLPASARLKNCLDLPEKLDELRLKRALTSFACPTGLISFLGAGATEHFVPEWISQQLIRAEWYTAYTPYQPEASQGTLQAIFQFQSMVASILGLEIANASMYDGATALVEALLMAIRTKAKKTVILSRAIHPEYRETAHTYLTAAECRVIEADFDQSGASFNPHLIPLVKERASDLAAIAVQSPNFFGRLEDIKKIAALAH